VRTKVKRQPHPQVQRVFCVASLLGTENSVGKAFFSLTCAVLPQFGHLIAITISSKKVLPHKQEKQIS
jgi:hypothetical protein